MDLPRTNPVGLPLVPPEFSQTPRRYPAAARALAAALLGALLAVVSVTTAVSLGAYCLTSDTANTRSLPSSYVRDTR